MQKVKSTIKILWLQHCYHSGQHQNSTPESHAQELVQLGKTLSTTAQTKNHQKHKDSPYRILLCTPPSMAASVWFADLEHGLAHMGVPHARVSEGTKIDKQLLDRHRPNVVIALDQDVSLKQIDLEALKSHKKKNGCLRLFIPSRTNLFQTPSDLSPQDSQRLALAKSDYIADAYCSLYETVLFKSHFKQWSQSGFPYLSLPQACNPLEDTPKPIHKNADWFYATVNNPARLNCTWTHLRPILKRHQGRWINGGWGFGLPAVKPTEMAEWYAQAKISLAPLIDFLRSHPAEISHRVFEAAACGAFQITSLTPVTRKFFSAKALVAVEHPLDFASAFEYWLPRSEERNRIAEHALLEVYAKHTVYHRIDRLIDFLDQHHQRF